MPERTPRNLRPLTEPDEPILMQVTGDMASFDGSVGADVIRSHALFLSRLARAGTWFSSDERIAIAAETRIAAACTFCNLRKEALSPHAVKGEHSTAPGSDILAPELIDRIHLVISDPLRVTKTAIDSLGESELKVAHYVEALGITVIMRSIDQACLGMGVPQHALPAPLAGEPSQEAPPGLGDIGAFLPMISTEPPPPPNEDLWGNETANVIRALSLVPDAVRDLKLLAEAQYLPLDDYEDLSQQRTLSRPQIELIGARVSAINECFY